MTRLRDQLCRAMRAHLKGQKIAVPEGSDVLWEAFQRLSQARSVGPHGPMAITFTEIEAYSRLMRMPLEPWHVDVILGLDRVWLEQMFRAAGAGPREPSAELSPAVFDAVIG